MASMIAMKQQEHGQLVKQRTLGMLLYAAELFVAGASCNSKAEDPIAVFWDIETARLDCSAAGSLSTYDVVDNIRAAISRHGVIKTLRAYWDTATTSLTSLPRIRSELASSGVSLIDCPGEGRQGASPKRLLVDLMCYAWDSRPSTICVITSDRDLAYAIATLRMRKYRLLLMAPASAHQDLTSQASVHMDWSRSTLGTNGTGPNDRDDGDEKLPPSSRPQGSFIERMAPHAPPPTAPLNARFKTSTTSGPVHGGSAPFVEMHDLPPRGRRNSVFSKVYTSDCNGSGSFGNGFMSPPLRNIPSFGLGDGPLFPKPTSRLKTSRSDSAPPNIFYSSLSATPPPTTPRPHFAHAIPEPPIPAATATSKGKERAFPIQDTDDVVPLVTSSPTPYASAFQPFEDNQTTTGTVTPERTGIRAQGASVRTVSCSSSSSSSSSAFSVIERPDASSAPTSAEQLDVNCNEKQQLAAQTLPPQISKTSAPLASPTSRCKEDSCTTGSVAAIAVSTTVKATPQEAPKPMPLSQPAFDSTSINTPPRNLPLHNIPVAASRPVLSAEPPKIWVPLINILRRAGGDASGSTLGGLLLKDDPKAYQKVGASKLKAYLEAAVAAGIVRTTGSQPTGVHVHLADSYKR